jgi:hypothetical protein
MIRAMAKHGINPSPPFRGEREGLSAQRWEGAVGIVRTAGVSPACRPQPGGPLELAP